MTHPLQGFLSTIHVPGTDTAIMSLNTILGYVGQEKISPLLDSHTDLYFLGGIDETLRKPIPSPRRIYDCDIIRKSYIAFDFDVRKEHPDLTDENIKEYAEAMGELLKGHQVLGGWRYMVFSGNGFHVYYTTTVPLTIEAHVYAEGYKRLCKEFDFLPTTLPDEACSNISRIFRLPYSRNTKGEPKQTCIVAENEDHHPAIFDALTEIKRPVVSVDTFLDRIKKEPIRNLCDFFRYQISKQNHVILNGTETSITLNLEGNYVNRFSGKPGSGDFVNLYMALEDLHFLDACAKISEKYFGEPLDITEEQLLKKEREVALKQRVEKLKVQSTPLSWNTSLMDKRFPPIKPYHYIVLSGETKSGKSTVAFDIAVKNAAAKRNILYITLEMTGDQLIENVGRAAAAVEPIDERYKMMYGSYKDEQQFSYQTKIDYINSLDHLHIRGKEYGKTFTIETVFETILKYPELDLVVVDNLDKIENKEKQTDFDKQKEASHRIMEFTNAFYIPIMLVHHLRKPMDERRAKWRSVDALSGTSKISHDANMVVMVSRDRDESGMYEEASTFVRVAETREFSPTIAKIYFHNGSFQDENPTVDFNRYTSR